MYFSEQRFLVAGLSRSGVAASQYLAEKGAREVFIYDDVESEGVAEATEKLKVLGCRAVSRENLSEASERSDVLVLSPGIPVDHPLPVAFRRMKKRILGEAELGVAALTCPIVAVTGTNGKTTTVTMIEEVLRAAGKNAIACGNVGKPITEAVGELKNDGIAVAEISSFQLETLTSLCPHIAVVMNVTEDHLNRHYNMENYIYLKSRILKNSTESEYAVLNYDDDIVRAFAENTKARVVWFSTREKVDGGYLEDGEFCFKGERLFRISELPLDGEHNYSDALAAICAAKLLGTGNAAIAAALKSFKGIKHRIQRLGDVNGVTFIDDSKATNVDSTVKAIASVRGETILLLGGKDKGYSYEPLFAAIKNSGVVHTVLYGENRFKILSAAQGAGFTAVTVCYDFDIAVRIAYLIAGAGQNVLLSPASASFDMFRNYEQRGDRFAEMFERLKAEKSGGLRFTERLGE